MGPDSLVSLSLCGLVSLGKKCRCAALSGTEARSSGISDPDACKEKCKPGSEHTCLAAQMEPLKLVRITSPT